VSYKQQFAPSPIFNPPTDPIISTPAKQVKRPHIDDSWGCLTSILQAKTHKFQQHAHPYCTIHCDIMHTLALRHPITVVL